ncbi:GNAT family N-acetyltransferase [Marinomonas balearica]|uniref:Acetyltransferase (GNAT) family protein n=1 Tax=Marinomonas balearica TaxID=491947 RepID=A0A4R6M605_9GAMM|nr:GNAT family N-acetyltransferase [Marinomonas balearica]TDO96684.1 acetyltransferase (GNAT) family protein [Marinomonas balearica]
MKNAIENSSFPIKEVPPSTIASLATGPIDTPLTDLQRLESEFVPFEQAPFWQNPKPTPPAMINAWVQSYSESLINWLLLGLEEERFDLNSPIHILQMMQDKGAFGLKLLAQLQQELGQEVFDEMPLCLLIVCDNQDDITLMQAHPSYQAYKESGKVNWLCFDEVNALIEQNESDLAIDFTANPVALIAHHVLSSLPQQLVHCHYNQLYFAEVASLKPTEESAQLGLAQGSLTSPHTNLPISWQERVLEQKLKEKGREKPKEEMQESERGSAVAQAQIPLAYRWHHINPDEFVESQLASNALHAPYLDYLNYQLSQGISQVLYLPVQASNLLNQLADRCDKGLLCLITEEVVEQHGVNDAQDTELLKHEPNANLAMPLALAPIIAALKNTQVAVQKTDQINSVSSWVSISNRALTEEGGLNETDQQHFNLIAAPLLEQTNRQQERIINSLQGATKVLDDRQILAYLSTHQYEPALCALFLPRLLETGVLVNLRLPWCEALSKVWMQHTPLGRGDEFTFKLGILAIDLGHWPLAKACFIALMKIDGPNTPCLHNLALAEFATGQIKMALTCTQLALELSSEDEQAKTLNDDICAYQARCSSLTCFDNRGFDNRDFDNRGFDNDQETHLNQANDTKRLTLQPLGEHHLSEFYLQYRRTDIAQRLRGITFDSLAELRDHIWPNWQQEGGCKEEGGKEGDCKKVNKQAKAHFALVHPELGFVGAVVFDFSQDDASQNETDDFPEQSAHLSFWIGCDYQQQGFATHAVKLAIEYLLQRGKTYLITSAWVHNTPSRKVLERNGFIQTNETKGEGVEQEMFYRFALPPSYKEESGRLI